MGLTELLRINDTHHNVMLSVTFFIATLSMFMPGVVMLNDILLCVVMLSVVILRVAITQNEALFKGLEGERGLQQQTHYLSKS